MVALLITTSLPPVSGDVTSTVGEAFVPLGVGVGEVGGFKSS